MYNVTHTLRSETSPEDGQSLLQPWLPLTINRKSHMVDLIRRQFLTRCKMIQSLQVRSVPAQFELNVSLVPS